WRHPVQQAQVVLRFRLLEADVPEGAARAVLVQHDWRRGGRCLCPGPECLDDPLYLSVLAGQLYLARAIAEQNQRAAGRLPRLPFTEADRLVGQPEYVCPQTPVHADPLPRRVAEPPQPRGFADLRQEVAADLESVGRQVSVGEHLPARDQIVPVAERNDRAYL